MMPSAQSGILRIKLESRVLSLVCRPLLWAFFRDEQYENPPTARKCCLWLFVVIEERRMRQIVPRPKGEALMKLPFAACSVFACLAIVFAGECAAQVPPVPEQPSSEVTRLAAECDQGRAKSCFNLGKTYAQGRGVAKDEKRAAELFQQACAGGAAGGCECDRSARPNRRTPKRSSRRTPIG